jgi:hypothetical protein
MSKFDLVLENELTRYQMGGFLVGDRIRFKKDALKHEYIANRAKSFQDLIASCMEPTFDLNLRIGALKSIYPSSATNFQSGYVNPDGVFADIYIEYAPGLYRNPTTVPLEVLELVDDGLQRGPIPDSLRRPNNVHGPEEQKTKQDDVKAEVNLTNKNVQLPGANKWDDSKPGGGNFKSKV